MKNFNDVKMMSISKIHLLSLGIFLLFFTPSLKSQVHFNLSLEGNYWEHTDLFGGQLAAGFDYRFGERWGIRASYGIGYGEAKRLKNKFTESKYLDPEKYINHQNGKDAPFLDTNQSSDHARQHQIDLAVFVRLFKINPKMDLNLQAGGFYSRIHHYYIIDYFGPVDFQFITEDNGELDLLIISDQRFYTVGMRAELNLEIEIKKGIVSPYIALGLGPNYTNFGTVGVRYAGLLKKE